MLRFLNALFFGNMAGSTSSAFRANWMMQTLTSKTRAGAALVLLVLLSQIGLAVRAHAEQAADPDSHCGMIPAANAGRKTDQAGDAAFRDDDFWLISTRHLGCPDWKGESTLDLRVSRYAGADEWIESDLEVLFNSEPRLTVIYVHGNRVSADDAITRGWEAIDALRADPAAPPMRLIIWSWPSDRIHGQVRDVRYKAARTNGEGQYLAWFLSRLDPDASVSLIAYSLGARVVTGALHILGGGTICGQSPPLAAWEGDRNPMQVVLMAAALHNNWLAPGGCHEHFWTYADRLLVIYNSCDPVLKRYRFIEKRGRPAAMGYAGAAGLGDITDDRFEQQDVCRSVGKTHREAANFASTQVIQSLQQHVLWQAAP